MRKFALFAFALALPIIAACVPSGGQTGSTFPEDWFSVCVMPSKTITKKVCSAMHTFNISTGNKIESGFLAVTASTPGAYIDIAKRNMCPGEQPMIKIDDNQAIALPAANASEVVVQMLAGQKVQVRVFIKPNCVAEYATISLGGFDKAWREAVANALR